MWTVSVLNSEKYQSAPATIKTPASNAVMKAVSALFAESTPV